MTAMTPTAAGMKKVLLILDISLLIFGDGAQLLVNEILST
jgi:hypothetical protein